MTKRIFSWVLLISLAGAAVRCSTPEKSTLCFVTTLTEVSGSQTRVYAYTYEFSRLTALTLTEAGQATVVTYFYDANGNVGTSVTQSPSGEEQGTYSYDKQNKLVAALHTRPDYEVEYQYVYNDNGQLITEIRREVKGGSAVRTRSFTYPDILTKNPSVITTTVDGSAPDQQSLEYDNKVAPLRNLFPTTQAVNNVVKETSLNGTTLEETTVTTSYQYNTAGYPVSAVSSAGKTQTWVYDCKEV